MVIFMKKRKNNKKISKYLSYFLIVIIPVVLFVFAFFIYTLFIYDSKGSSTNESIYDNTNYQDIESTREEIGNYVNELPDYRQQYSNPNIMGK